MKPNYRELQRLCKLHKLPVKCTSSGKVLTEELIKKGILINIDDGVLSTTDVSTAEDAVVVPPIRYSPTFEASKTLPLMDIFAYGIKGNMLGRGGFGTVFKYSNEFAIKKTSAKDAVEEELPPADLLLEIAIMKRLQHPNIAQILDVVVDVNATENTMRYGIVMPLAVSDLKKAVVGASVDTINGMAYQILCGVAYMHSRHILHRDIKPYNILYYANGDVRIADFGISKPFACEPNAHWTVEVYTLWYRAPEVLLSTIAEYYEPADIWAVGTTLYELYTGKVLFPGGDIFNELSLIYHVLGTPGVDDRWPDAARMKNYRLGTIYPENRDRINFPLPNDDIRRIINSMLVYEPSDRPSAYDILSDPYFDPYRKPERESLTVMCAASHETRDLYATEPKDKTHNDFTNINLRYSTIATVCHTFNYHIRTYLMAASIFDQVLVLPGEVILNGLTPVVCTSIAANLSEMYTNEAGDYIKHCQDKYTISEFNIQRRRVLEALNYDLIFTTPYDYYPQNSVNGVSKYWQLAKSLMVVIPFTTIKYQILPYDVYNLVVALTLAYHKKPMTAHQQQLFEKYRKPFIIELSFLDKYTIPYFDLQRVSKNLTYEQISTKFSML